MVTDARRIPDKIAKPVKRRDGALRIANRDKIKGISASLKLLHDNTRFIPDRASFYVKFRAAKNRITR